MLHTIFTKLYLILIKNFLKIYYNLKEIKLNEYNYLFIFIILFLFLIYLTRLSEINNFQIGFNIAMSISISIFTLIIFILFMILSDLKNKLINKINNIKNLFSFCLLASSPAIKIILESKMIGRADECHTPWGATLENFNFSERYIIDKDTSELIHTTTPTTDGVYTPSWKVIQDSHSSDDRVRLKKFNKFNEDEVKQRLDMVAFIKATIELENSKPYKGKVSDFLKLKDPNISAISQNPTAAVVVTKDNKFSGVDMSNLDSE